MKHAWSSKGHHKLGPLVRMSKFAKSTRGSSFSFYGSFSGPMAIILRPGKQQQEDLAHFVPVTRILFVHFRRYWFRSLCTHHG